jgi:hypothetical protein
MSTSRPNSMITDDTFVNKHAFSFQGQPYLKQLFDIVQVGRLPLTIVAGAGVSMNASLPSWTDLLSAMADEIADAEPADADLASIVGKVEPDLMRQADIILHIARQQNQAPIDEDVAIKQIIKAACTRIKRRAPGG